MKKIAIALAVLGLMSALFATTMTVHTTSGNQEFEINEITSISFENDENPDPPENMIFVEGGIFQMGDRIGNGGTEELPLHQVTLDDFFIGKYEVTQFEYESVTGENPPQEYENEYGELYPVGDDYPVFFVTWYDAIEFCNLLSVQEGLNPCYNVSSGECDFSANGYRLATEAEWEYAARGGIYEADNYQCSGTTDNLIDYAWFSENNNPLHTKPVGQKLPNQLGIFDMSGNAYEWCNDWFGNYSSEDQTNPVGPDNGSQKVRRGGGWSSSYSDCRVAHRYEGNPDYGNSGITIRLVRNVE
jgi:formylglycine-generating enzyme required for sulfatase activity